MNPALILKAPSSHLYPGARAGLDGSQSTGAAEAASRPCLIEFSDGSIAFGELTSGEAGRALLAIKSYRTVRGTAIPAKSWWLTIGTAAEGARAYRIEGRAADNNAVDRGAAPG